MRRRLYALAPDLNRAGVIVDERRLARVEELQQASALQRSDLKQAAAPGASVGARASSMISISTSNRQIAAFEDAIKHGGILMVIDGPIERGEAIQQLVRSKHDEVQFGEMETHIPAFP